MRALRTILCLFSNFLNELAKKTSQAFLNAIISIDIRWKDEELEFIYKVDSAVTNIDLFRKRSVDIVIFICIGLSSRDVFFTFVTI